MENLLVAITNAPAIYPISKSILRKDYWTTTALGIVTVASVVSHLIENHKHGMPGLGFSQNTSYYLNRMDVAGCAALCARLAYCYWSKYRFDLSAIYQRPYLIAATIFTMFLGRISEYDKYNAKLKWFYIPTHCAWHLSVFPLIGYFLEKVIY